MSKKLTNEQLRKRLAFPGKFPISVALDTDTYNEVDDQFALAYMLLSPETYDVRGIFAAPFFNKRSNSPGHGMELSYDEILRILGYMGVSGEGLVYKGSDRILASPEEPVDSPAARRLIELAMSSSPDDPLYIIAIGAITNIASALLIEPAILDRIVLVWLGGNRLPNRRGLTHEFNTLGDLIATKYIFDIGVPLIQVPCWGVSSHLTTTVPELNAYLSGKNRLCDELIKTFSSYVENTYGWAKELWDVGAASYFINKDWFNTREVLSLSASDEELVPYKGSDGNRHIMLTVESLDRTGIFRDMFDKLSRAD